MPTTSPPAALFRRWIDDAAVFPPGNSPIDLAWSEHRALRAGPYADLLGPLLIGAAGAGELAEISATPDPDIAPVEVVVIARPGTPVNDLLAAVKTLREAEALDVVGVEVAHDPAGDWVRALDLGLPTAVEVSGADRERAAALDEMGALAGATQASRLVAKLRTQSTPQSAVPTPHDLASFLLAADERDLSVKLTGGLHHAITSTVISDGATEDQHGALNVLLAVHDVTQGADVHAVTATLAHRDGAALADRAAGLTEDQVRTVRDRFVSFGCCGVLDPIGDLVSLGLIRP